MPKFSHATIAGHLVRDPETKQVGDNTVTNLTVAVNGKREKDETIFMDCAAWGKRGETIAQYLGKGDPILVSGSLRQESWEAKDGGGKRSKIKLDVQDFTFVGKKVEVESGTKPSGEGFKRSSKPKGSGVGGHPDPDDIPF